MVYHGLPWFTIPPVTNLTWQRLGNFPPERSVASQPPDPQGSWATHGDPEALWLHEILSYCWSTCHFLRVFFFAPSKATDFFGTIHSIRCDLVRCITENIWYLETPSGSLTWQNGKSPCLIAKYSINGPLSIAILNGVCMTIYSNLSFDYVFTE